MQDWRNPDWQSPQPTSGARIAEQALAGRREAGLLLTRVCLLTMLAVLCTGLGSAIFWVYPSMVLFFVGLIGGFVMLFVCRAVAERFPLNIAALCLFASLEGLMIGPILTIYAKVNGPGIILEASAICMVIFAMVGTLGYTSTRSYAHWLPWLFGALFVMILVGIVFMFVGGGGSGYWLYSVAGAVLFTVFVFVDFTRIRHEFSANQYIAATMAIYLDLINLFLFILRLLGRRD